MTLRLPLATIVDRMPAPIAELVGRSERLKSLLRPLVNRSVPRAETVITVRAGVGRGLRLLVDPQREKYYWTGGHEPHLQRAIAERLAPGGTFWDVGAHIGFFTLQAARCVGAAGHVIAFEPIPDNQRRLSCNLALNGAQNVDIVGEALADEAGEMPIYPRSGSSLMWTLDAERSSTDGQMVRVGTLDGHRALPRPDLVKIDAEGFESAVLRGAPELIAARCTAFLVEFMSDELLEDGKRLLVGYSFTLLGDNHWLATPPRQTA